MLIISQNEFQSLVHPASHSPFNTTSEIFKQDGLGIMVCKLPNLEMIWGKPQDEDFFGFTFEEVTHHPSFVIQQLHPDDLLRASIDIGTKIDGQPIHEIYRVQNKSGKYRTTLLSSVTFQVQDNPEDVFVLMRYCNLSDLIQKKNLYEVIQDESEQVRANLILSGLNTQEKTVLSHIGYAKQDKEIAEEMNLSIASIIQYRRRLLRFFNVNSKLSLVRIAFQSGLVK